MTQKKPTTTTEQPTYTAPAVDEKLEEGQQMMVDAEAGKQVTFTYDLGTGSEESDTSGPADDQ